MEKGHSELLLALFAIGALIFFAPRPPFETIIPPEEEPLTDWKEVRR